MIIPPKIKYKKTTSLKKGRGLLLHAVPPLLKDIILPLNELTARPFFVTFFHKESSRNVIRVIFVSIRTNHRLSANREITTTGFPILAFYYKIVYQNSLSRMTLLSKVVILFCSSIDKPATISTSPWWNRG